ncbi:hypothetical protein ACGFYM_27580 [Streptomyces sp. NPDC048231]|uniref:hypothetical protein n=1 Tax=Streptomyces sp. NPDC048231 TaxID=3365519 RepID=UPI0037225CAF
MTAIERSGAGVATESDARVPVHGWDGGHVWTLFKSEKIAHEECFIESRMKLRPFEDIPDGDERDAESITVTVFARAWIPGDPEATWSRLVDYRKWQRSDFPEHIKEDDMVSRMQTWIIPAWISAVRDAEVQARSLRPNAEKRRRVMDSEWNSQ